MNKLKGIITQIQSSGALLLVDADVEGQKFSALLIESNPRHVWLKEGNQVNLVFKETEVSLAKELTGRISLRNRMKCRVLAFDRGELLSTVKLQFNHYALVSAITTRSADMLELKEGDEIEALVKANEVSLMQL